MNRFELEQGILACWNIVDDIKALNRQMLDVREMTPDEISNYLLGLETIYQIKFEQTFATFEACIKDGSV
jgi:hypothetical protein